MPQFYIEECYSNGYYNECISECESLLKNCESDKLRSKLMLIQGKALFHAYCNDQDKLRKQQLPEKLYHQRHSTCYSKTKTVILLLGSLLDKDLLDDEGSKILDLSMIDYIYETNDLNSCKRCLLCRKKNKLKKSHLWPRVLLEAFSSGVEMPTTRRVLLVSWQSQDRYWSPKEVTFFMYCASCEDLLSGHGETQFAPMFFRQIYDVSMTGKSQSASSIEYGKWLYEFCIGVIFRGIAQRYMLKFVNSEEIYEVLTICRNFLLQCPKNSAPIVREQDIFIMIGPTEAKGKATESGFINRVLNMPALYGVEDIQLSNGLVAVPRAAHYFIAHLGLINILTKFKCSTYTFNGECKIDPNGGIFIVPENEYRKCVLPLGVWTLFLSLAQDFEVNWLTRSTKAVQQYVKPEKKEPNKTLRKHLDLLAQLRRTSKHYSCKSDHPYLVMCLKLYHFFQRNLSFSDQSSDPTYVYLNLIMFFSTISFLCSRMLKKQCFYVWAMMKTIRVVSLMSYTIISEKTDFKLVLLSSFHQMIFQLRSFFPRQPICLRWIRLSLLQCFERIYQNFYLQSLWRKDFSASILSS